MLQDSTKASVGQSLAKRGKVSQSRDNPPPAACERNAAAVAAGSLVAVVVVVVVDGCCGGVGFWLISRQDKGHEAQPNKNQQHSQEQQ